MDNSYIDDIYLINNESYYFHREIGEWLVFSRDLNDKIEDVYVRWDKNKQGYYERESGKPVRLERC